MIEKERTATASRDCTPSVSESGGIPRASGMSSLGRTLKLKIQTKVLAGLNDEERKDLHLMKGYINQVESVLQEMKEWVNKKEKSISSKASVLSKRSILSKGRSPNGDQYKRSQRAKIFFGFTDQTVGNSNAQQGNLNKCFQQFDRKRVEDRPASNPKSGLGVYLKDCFMANIKQRLLPPQKRRNAIHRNKSGYELDKLRDKSQKGCLNDEPIDFLTPVKNSDIQKSAVKVGLMVDQDDSLVYTVSRRRNSLRFVNTEASEGAINNFD